MADGFPKQIPPKDFGRYLGGISIQGPQGPQGKFGTQGAEGPQGPQGLSGEAAAVGAQGPQGAQGSAGVQGDTGAQGAQGSNSAQIMSRDFDESPAVVGTAPNANDITFEFSSVSTDVSDITDIHINYIQGASTDQEALAESVTAGQNIVLTSPDGTVRMVGRVTVVSTASLYASYAITVLSHDGSSLVDGETLYLDAGSQAGTQGSQGSQGNQGTQGFTGVQGSQGAQGATGSQGIQGSGYGGTSLSTHALTTTSKIFVTQAGLAYNTGSRVKLTSTADPTSFVQGRVTSYAGTNLTVDVDYFEGTPSANFSSWNISIAGEVGPQGLAGPQGVQGTTGSQGDDGTTGPQGSQGSQGVTGAQGDTGSQGAQGDAGTTGPQGSQGDAGPQGVQGANGPQGNVGSTGAQGPQGTQGSQGEIGAQGSQGPQGDDGAGYDTTSNTALNLSIGVKSLVIGANKAYSAGDRALLKSSANTNNQMSGIVSSYNSGTGSMDITIDSFQGSGSPYNDWLVSLGGAAGPQGVQGVTGSQGVQGAQGDTGAQGATYGGTSTTSETLDVGSRTLTIQTNKAYQTGDRIRAAYTSSPGDTYVEGNVDSYNAGTGVLVFTADVVAGTIQLYANWVVNLTGTRGAQGVQGVQGTQGNQGVQGVQGAQGNQGIQGSQGVQGAQSAFYNGTSTTSAQIGTGSRSLVTQTGLAWLPGARVKAYATAGGGDYIEGIVSAYNSGTGVLEFISDRYIGTIGTPYVSWQLSLTGEVGGQGPQGTQGFQGSQAAQAPLEVNSYTRTASSSTTSDSYALVNGDAVFTITLVETGKIWVSSEFTGGNSAEGGDVRVVIQNSSPSTVFTSDEVSFPATDTNRYNIQGLTDDLPAGDYTVRLEYKSDVNSNTASITQVAVIAQAQLAGRGPQGTQGTQGVTGAQGVAGAQGNQGVQGAIGAQGSGYAGTATDSIAIGTGSKVFNTQTGLAFLANMRVRVASQGTPNRWMEGSVTSYVGGVLTVNVTSVNGSGTYTDWGISVAGEIGPQGAQGATGASAGGSGWVVESGVDPGVGEVRFLASSVDETDMSAIDEIRLDGISADADDYTSLLTNLPVGSLISIKNLATGAHSVLQTSGAPSIATSLFTFSGLTVLASQGSVLDGQTVDIEFGLSGTQGVQGPQGNTGVQGPQGTQGTQGDLVTTQHARVSIGNATNTVSPTFGTAFGDTNYTLIVSLTNTIDLPPSDYMLKVTAKSTTGFTVTLSGNTDSANYVLEYFAIHD